MLESSFITENTDLLRTVIKNKGVTLNLDELLKVDGERRQLIRAIEDLNQQRNTHAAAAKARGGKPTPEAIEAGRRVKQELAEKEPVLRSVEKRFQELLLLVPNVYSDDTPIGPDESANVELRKWGTIPKFPFLIKDHEALGSDLDIIDTARGVKVSGFRGYYLKKDAARLQWALMSYCIEKMQSKGYTFMITPTMVRDAALFGSGHFPSQRDEAYPVGDEKYLAGTSEPALLAYRADEVLDKSTLPLKYCAVSPCYRREVGSYGKDTKGLYRVHEFWKVEQVILCENDLPSSLSLFEEMLANAEEVVRDLELPYRVVQICTGDMGAGKYKMYDIETWMPVRAKYGETHSCSHLTDWQTRRLNIRYKALNGKFMHPYAMNNTVIASPRILIALLENYQQSDGTVVIPKALRPYMGGKDRITA